MQFKNLREKLEAIKSGKLTSEENVKNFLKKIESRDKKIKAFIQINPHAIAEAKEVDKKIRQRRKTGKLVGLTVAVKSNICVQGLLTSCGSKTLSNFYAPYDADVISRIKQEDGIIIGMANMDEFACGSSGETSFYGATENPAAEGHIPGGTSSGSAAAVAAEFCDVALGSDTGGSIRNPASHCGICGIKPTYARVSRYGLIDAAMSLEQIGILSKDTFGSALLLSVIAGPSSKDATTVPEKVDYYTKFKIPKNLRVGVSKEFEQLCVEEGIYRIIEYEIKKLSEAYGWQIKNVNLKYVNLAVQAYYPIVYTEFFSSTRKFDGRRFGYKIEETCGEEVLRRILGGAEISKAEYRGQYYKKALAVKSLIAEDFSRAFKEVDIIISPTVPKLPHKIGETIEDPRVMYAYDAYTIPANLAGIPACVLPAGNFRGIPVGMQLMTRHFAEEMLFNVMHAYEKLKEKG